MTRLPAALLLAPLLVVAALATEAAVAGPGTAECRGEAATIEASDQAVVTGTDGPDVIVVREVDQVQAGGGGDLVCASAPSGHTTEIDAGAGNDVVETVALGERGRPYFIVSLNTGDDQFIGGAGTDYVRDGDRLNPGHDEIDTGAGDDRVESGRARTDNNDVIRLGGGADQVTLRGRVVGSVEDGGAGGRDAVVLTERQQVAHDLELRPPYRTRIGSEEVALSGFESATLPGDASSISVRGGDGRNEVTVFPRRRSGAVALDLDLGAGDDELTVYGVGTARGAIALGTGVRDELVLDSGKGFSAGTHPFTGAVTGSLTGRLDAAGGRLDLSGIEDLTVTFFRRLDLRADAAANLVRANACFVEIAGGPGDDRVFTGPAPRSECPGRDGEGALLLGQAGSDVLDGTALDDVLIGGPGIDRADGGPAGDDRCAAETTINCDRT